MLTVLVCFTGVALALAGTAWVRARQIARRLADLDRSHWELRYEHGQLASRLHLVEARAGLALPQDEPPDPAHRATAFIPIASLKKTS